MEDVTKYPVIIDGEKYQVQLEDEGLDNFARRCIRVSFSKIKPNGILDLDYECLMAVNSVDSYVEIIKNAAAEFSYQKERDKKKYQKEAALQKELEEWDGIIEC